MANEAVADGAHDDEADGGADEHRHRDGTGDEPPLAGRARIERVRGIDSSRGVPVSALTVRLHLPLLLHNGKMQAEKVVVFG